MNVIKSNNKKRLEVLQMITTNEWRYKKKIKYWKFLVLVLQFENA